MSDIVTEGIILYPGAKLLYRNASGLEKSMADVDGERLIGTYAEIINDQWNPYKISYNNLPYLGYAMGVMLWEDGWSESTQREWIAHQFEYKSLRGTPDGIEMALNYTGRDFTGGYFIKQMMRPPQCFFASPTMSKEAYDFWISLLPEIRITFY
ncbi:MAG TPA: phage tail protein I, partial [Mesorhizobium sp.]|nr:phage tail protein I [Mesorhizobium sp.]